MIKLVKVSDRLKKLLLFDKIIKKINNKLEKAWIIKYLKILLIEVFFGSKIKKIKERRLNSRDIHKSTQLFVEIAILGVLIRISRANIFSQLFII